jgi:hypothetical protein
MARRQRSGAPVSAPTSSAGPVARFLQHTSPLTAAEEADKDHPIHACSIDDTDVAPDDNAIVFSVPLPLLGILLSLSILLPEF